MTAVHLGHDYRKRYAFIAAGVLRKSSQRNHMEKILVQLV